MRRGEIWEVQKGTSRVTVLIVSINDANQRFAAAVCILLHPLGAYPDTVLSVALAVPPTTAFALNLLQMREARFSPAAGASRLGSATVAEMDLVDRALRNALDLL